MKRSRGQNFTDHSNATPNPPSALPGWAPAQLVVLALLSTGIAHAGDAGAHSSAVLRAQYVALQDRLDNNPYQRPLHLDSSETTGGVKGSIYALVRSPFAQTSTALNGPVNWCDILNLHLNTKYCRASKVAAEDVLNISIGTKHDQPLDEASRVVFNFRVAALTPDYLQVMLNADEGPLSTRDYRIALEAIPLDDGRTLIHLEYAYAYGLAGRLAMQAYLGTIGKNKVGFTIAGTQADGRPRYIGGMRGLVERNTMRYYLAIEAYLGALSAPPQAQLEKRLNDWFAASEHWPRQLHEMERDTYLNMKRKEHRRQTALPAGHGG